MGVSLAGERALRAAAFYSNGHRICAQRGSPDPRPTLPFPRSFCRQNSAPFHICGTDNLRSLATYYHLPTLSTRSLLWDTAFDGLTPASPEPHNVLGVWHADYDHPNSAGHGAIADMLVTVLRRAAASLAERPLSAEELAAAARRPAPLYRGNEAAAGAACFVGDAFRRMAVAADGFAWTDEGHEGAAKWGFTANATGAWVEFELDTSRGGLDGANATAGLTALGVSHLRSYENMAVAELTCAGGCACAPTRLDGRLEFRVSQTYISRALVGRAARCRVRVAVLDEGDGDGRHFKLGGLMLSPAPDDHALAADLQHFGIDKLAG